MTTNHTQQLPASPPTTDQPQTGPLSWPQLDWVAGWRFDAHPDLHRTDSFETYLHCVFPVPFPVRLQEALKVIGALIARHESLRTKFLVNGIHGGQQLCSPTSQAEAIANTVTTVVTDHEVESVYAEQVRPEFDLSRQWPLRIVIGADARTATVGKIAVIVNHLAVDGWGMTLLLRELMELLQGQHTAWDQIVPDMIEHPLETSRWERSESGRNHERASLAIWKNTFQAIAEAGPSSLRSTAQAELPTFRTCWYDSQSLSAAVKQASRRLRIPASTVFLTAVGSALADLTASSAIGLAAHSMNRLHLRQRRAVSQMVTRSPVLFSRSDSTDLATVARGVLHSHMHGVKAANVDRVKLEALRAEILPIGLSPVVADVWLNFQNTATAGTNPIGGVFKKGSLGVPGYTLDTVHEGRPRSRGRTFMVRVADLPDQVSLQVIWRDDIADLEFVSEAIQLTTRWITKLAEI